MILKGTVLSLLLLLFFATSVEAQAEEGAHPTWLPQFNPRTGAVFVMSNRRQNGIFVFMRDRNGGLSQSSYFLTGGSGDPIPQGDDPERNPLFSQGSLMLTNDRDLLLAANAGSSEITVFRVTPAGLTRLQVIKSGGIRPVSIAVFEDIVYVLNEGASPNIFGFTIGRDDLLVPIENSRRELPTGIMADPAQIGFSRDGRLLVVTEKKGNVIDTFRIDINGHPGLVKTTPVTGMTPYGFAFTTSGHLVVAEAFASNSVNGAASSYDLNGQDLSVITASLPSAGTHSCCIAVTRNARTAFILNSTGRTISSYRIGDDGTLRLTAPRAAVLEDGSLGVEMAFDHTSQYLYVLDGGTAAIAAFAVGYDGTLRTIGSFGLLPTGVQGIAAR